MLTRIAVLGALLTTLGLTGCGAQKGETRVKWEKGHDAMMTTADMDGDYALYTMTDLTPQIVKPLHRGDRLGFEVADNETVRAVAGDYIHNLPKGTMKAYWKHYTDKK